MLKKTIEELYLALIPKLKQLLAIKQQEAAQVQPPVAVPVPTPKKYLFDTIQNARNSVIVICDEEGLSPYQKDVIMSCIQQESGFSNKAVGRNRNKQGVVTSTDWGICQINDYWNIGMARPFPSIDYVVQNPDKVIRWMIKMMRQGKMHLWVSYSSGAYLKYMPQGRTYQSTKLTI